MILRGSSWAIPRWARRLLSAAALLLAIAPDAHAVTTSWNTNSSGVFTSPANWDNGVPGILDTAVFNRGFVAYEVNFPGGSIFDPPPNYVIDRLQVRHNEVSFVYNNSPVITTPSVTVGAPSTTEAGRGIIVGHQAGDIAILNDTLPSISSLAATIGDAVGAAGTLNVFGNLHLTGSNAATHELIVGNRGGGTLSLAAGGRVNVAGEHGDFVLGNYAGSSGVVSVTGEGSLLNSVNLSTSAIGREGMGVLFVTSGGDVAILRAVIGELTGSSGMVTVDGAGSTWTSGQSIIVGFLGTGSLTITGGGQVAVADGDPFTQSDLLVGRASSVSVDGVGSRLTAEGNLTAGSAQGSGDALVNVTNGGQIVSDFGLVSSGGNILIDGIDSKWTSDGVVVGFSNGTGVLDVKGGGEIDNTGDASVGVSSIAPPPSGMVSVDGLNSRWTNSGELRVGNGAVHIKSGAQLTSANSTIGGDQFASGSTALVHVSGVGSTWIGAGMQSIGLHGTLRITGGGRVNGSHVEVDRGTVDVEGAGSRWTLSGDLTVENGTLIVSNGAAVSVGGILLIQSSGLLKGAVQGDGGITATVINRGVLSPGGSTGALQIDGNLIQSAVGELQIELAGTTPGTSYDQLLVSGLASLAGSLNVTTIDMFAPQAGDSFDVLDWGSRGGTFSTVTLPTLAAGLSWDVSQLYASGALSVVAAPSFTADFDLDGDVDGDDLTQWEGDFGVNDLSDADDDGDSDGADFLAWQRQLGSGLPVTPTADAVPEPSGLIMALSIACWPLIQSAYRRRQSMGFAAARRLR